MSTQLPPLEEALPTADSPKTRPDGQATRAAALLPFRKRVHRLRREALPNELLVAPLFPEEGQPPRLELGTWEQEQLAVDPPVDPAGERTLRDLVEEALSLVSKALYDTEALEKVEGQLRETFRIQAELMLNAAIGRALSAEIQTQVEFKIRLGQTTAARPLSDLSHKILRTTKLCEHAIADSERRMADARTEQALGDSADFKVREQPDAVDALERAFDATADLAELDPIEEMRQAHERERAARIEAQARRRARRLVKLPTRTGTLAIAFFVTSMVWGALTYAPQSSVLEARVIGRTDLPVAIESNFAEIRALPPSFFAVVEVETWSNLSEIEQKMMIGSLGDRLSVEGYRGALIEDRTGRPVARWLTSRGAFLVKRGEEPLAPAAAPAAESSGPTGAAEASPPANEP